MTATHLPIPELHSSAIQMMQGPPQMTAPQAIPMPDQSPIEQYPFTMSVPSSASSTYSSLPHASSGFFNMSNQSFAALSASVSGRSTPNTLFSPAISTPGMGTSVSTTSESTPATWATDPNSSSSALEMSTKNKKSSSRGKGKASQNRTTGNHDVPILEPVPPGAKRGHKSSKRRKSEPQPEEFRVISPPMPDKQVGLGVIMDDGSMWQATPSGSGGDRPKYRRTHSEGTNMPLAVAESSKTRPDAFQVRSPTPPFLSGTGGGGSEYFPSPIGMDGQNHAGQGGVFFAATVMVALSMSGLAETLTTQLGMSHDDLEEIRGDLSGVYERWRLAKGLRGVTIAQSPVTGNLGQPGSSTMVTSRSSTLPATTEDEEVSAAPLSYFFEPLLTCRTRCSTILAILRPYT